MLAVIAAIVLFVAFILHAVHIATDAVFAPVSLLFIGLACLALHMAGIGPAWSLPRRRR